MGQWYLGGLMVGVIGQNCLMSYQTRWRNWQLHTALALAEYALGSFAICTRRLIGLLHYLGYHIFCIIALDSQLVIALTQCKDARFVHYYLMRGNNGNTSKR